MAGMSLRRRQSAIAAMMHTTATSEKNTNPTPASARDEGTLSARATDWATPGWGTRHSQKGQNVAS